MSNTQSETYIAILRGINVSGKNMIKMPALVKAMEDLGYASVRSYIQSGNLIFEARRADQDQLANSIHKEIKKEFGFDVPVLVLRHEELLLIRNENPFLKTIGLDASLFHVTFLESIPHAGLGDKIDADKFLPDEFRIEGKAVYLYCPTGYGKTKLHNGFFETKLKVKATTRNWNTVNKLIEMCGEGNA